MLDGIELAAANEMNSGDGWHRDQEMEWIDTLATSSETKRASGGS